MEKYWSNKWRKLMKHDGRITLKAHAQFQTITKTPSKFQKVWFLIVLGFDDMSTLWVVLCRLPEKGTKEVELIVEEMKERDREEREK